MRIRHDPRRGVALLCAACAFAGCGPDAPPRAPFGADACGTTAAGVAGPMPSPKPGPAKAPAAAPPRPSGDAAPADHEHETEGISVPPETDLGAALEGQTLEARLPIRRPPGAPLRLGRLLPSCDCVTASVDRRTFAPDESAEVTVRVETPGLSGEERFEVGVEVLEPVRTVLRAPLRLRVERVPARLRVEPDELYLGSVDDEAEADVVVWNLGRRGVSLSRPGDPPPAGVAMSFPEGAEIPAGGRRTVRLRYVAGARAPGPIAGVLSFATTLPEHARVDVPFTGMRVAARH